MTHIEKMKQWLEALEVVNSCIDDYYLPKEKAWLPEIEQAITSLRQAIAEAEAEKENALQSLHNENERLGLYKDAYAEQEPVAWMRADSEGNPNKFRLNPFGGSVPLYTNPPQRKPLTDEQYFEIGQRHWLPSNKIEQIHKEIESKLKEKNT